MPAYKAKLINELVAYFHRHPAKHVPLSNRIHILTGSKLSLAELDELTAKVEARLNHTNTTEN